MTMLEPPLAPPPGDPPQHPPRPRAGLPRTAPCSCGQAPHARPAGHAGHAGLRGPAAGAVPALPAAPGHPRCALQASAPASTCQHRYQNMWPARGKLVWPAKCQPDPSLCVSGAFQQPGVSHSTHMACCACRSAGEPCSDCLAAWLMIRLAAGGAVPGLAARRTPAGGQGHVRSPRLSARCA